MSFRSKLLLTILSIVAATTAATLVIVQKTNADLHALAIDQIFTAETASFRARQQQPLDAATAQASSLAESVRLFAALEEGDNDIVYATAGDELRSAEFSFFRFTTPDGTLIPPPPDAITGPQGIDDSIRSQFRVGSRSVNAGSGPVQLGFITHGNSIYSVVSSAVALGDQVVGHLLIGQPVAGPPPHDGPSASNLSSALFVNGEVISRTLPPALLGELESWLGGRDLVSNPLQSGDVRVLQSESFRIDFLLLNPGSTFAPAYLVSLYSLAEFERRQRALNLRIVAIGCAGLLVATGAAIVIAGRLTRPVSELVEGTSAIRKGDYEVRVTRRSGDELGVLADSFNEMADGLALKERYRSVLQLVTDPTVADELLAGIVQLGGETREVTVVFCDIRGFTAMSQGMAPADVIALLNDHMSALTHIVQDHQGVVDKFVGDEIMILFGAPKSYGDDAIRAVRCAQAMIRRREEMNSVGPRSLAIGIGIATGQVLAGCMGSEKRLDYTVVGERVNLASRLCGQAAPMEIVIDEATRATFPPEFTTDPPESLSLKGFSGTVTAYRIRMSSL